MLILSDSAASKISELIEEEGGRSGDALLRNLLEASGLISPPAAADAGRHDPIGPDLVDDLLVDPQVGRAGAGWSAEPPGLLPRLAAVEGVHELGSEILGDGLGFGRPAVGAAGLGPLEERRSDETAGVGSFGRVGERTHVLELFRGSVELASA